MRRKREKCEKTVNTSNNNWKFLCVSEVYLNDRSAFSLT